ncbi:uncharacterized protein LOC132183999 [Corylus avellana]|uniref:uncharacterized protein LOC132183999 n=1 Tax=Corylus avellana TaxID=13451 RepID=UPI00286D2951|nr:uncharacterized protein LOC132183999 [Corylus avellana]
MARGCNLLENYSNQVIVWTSGETGFTFINCLSSVNDEEESKCRRLCLLKMHFLPLLQIYMEDQLHDKKGIHSISSQTEIPEWFSYQNKSGSSVAIMLPDNLVGNSSWRGIAFCIVFKVKNVSPGQDSKYFHEFICHLNNDRGIRDSPLDIINVPKDKLPPGSYGLGLYVSNARFRDHLDERSCISPSFTINNSDVEIQKCGARLIYEEDTVELVQNLFPAVFGSPEDCRQRHESLINPSPSHVDEAESSQSSGQSDLNPRLNRQLKSLLSLTYQIQIEGPPRWFKYQNFDSCIRMELPSNLNDNTRWLGFTVVILSNLEWAFRCLETLLMGHIDF